jgi:hypothetical protein
MNPLGLLGLPMIPFGKGLRGWTCGAGNPGTGTVQTPRPATRTRAPCEAFSATDVMGVD